MIQPSDHTAGIEPVAAEPRTSFSAASVNSKVFICLPWQKQTNPMTTLCVAALQDRRKSTLCLNFGDAFVAHSRNVCADRFLASKCDWSFWMDDDMLVPFGNATWFNAYSGANLPEEFAGLHAIERLLSHGKTLVGGLYFGRHQHGPPMYGEGRVPQEADYARKAPMNVVKPTRWVATGCMMVHRSVFEDIEKKYPRLARGKDGKGGNWFTSSEHKAMDLLQRIRETLSGGRMDGELAYKVHQMVESGIADANASSSLGIGEDVQFCVRAKECGHQPHVDMGLVCGHIGHAIYGPWNTVRK